MKIHFTIDMTTYGKLAPKLSQYVILKPIEHDYIAGKVIVEMTKKINFSDEKQMDERAFYVAKAIISELLPVTYH